MSEFLSSMIGELKRVYNDKSSDIINSHIMLNLTTFLIIILSGMIISFFIERAIKRVVKNSRMDGVITGFIVKLVKSAIIVITLITALPYIGIKTTTLLAVVGAAGLAIGLSLQSSLSNVSSGILLLIFQPFQYRDHIKIGNVEGIVDELNIMNTTLTSIDGSIVTIPNSSIINNAIVNYTKNPYKKNEVSIYIGNSINEKTIMEKLEEMIKAHELTLSEFAVTAGIKKIEKDGVDIILTWWTKDEDNERSLYDILLNTKKILDKQTQ